MHSRKCHRKKDPFPVTEVVSEPDSLGLGSLVQLEACTEGWLLLQLELSVADQHTAMRTDALLFIKLLLCCYGEKQQHRVEKQEKGSLLTLEKWPTSILTGLLENMLSR